MFLLSFQILREKKKRKMFSLEIMHHALFTKNQKVKKIQWSLLKPKSKITFSHLKNYEIILHNRYSCIMGVALHLLSPKTISKRDSTIPIL